MDRQTQLWLSITIYQSGKCLQPIFQICYISWLTTEGKDDATFFTVLGCLILFLILISYYFLYISKENLWDENTNFLEYWILTVLEIAIFITTISAYPAAVVHFTHLFKYNDHIQLLYPNDSENSTGLKVNEMNRSPQDLPDETFEEEIENTTNILIDKALNFRSGLISFMRIEENSSEIMVIPKDEYSVITPLHRVGKDINIFVLVTICSFLSHLTVFLSLGWIEFVKYKIRTGPPPLPPPPQRRRVPPSPPLSPPLPPPQRQHRSRLQRTSLPPERTSLPPERASPPPERTLPAPPEETPPTPPEGAPPAPPEGAPPQPPEGAPPQSPEGTPPLPEGAPPLPEGAPPLPEGAPPLPEGAPPLPEGTPPLPEGTPPLPEGTPPLPEGTPPLPEGTPPPPEGTPPPPEGTPPPTEGTPPPTEGTPPPTEGTPPPTEGTPPPTEGTPPPPEGTPPPPEGTPPPTEGTPPPPERPPPPRIVYCWPKKNKTNINFE